MSFRMRGAALDQGCRTARYAATWVLIVSMTSSSIVLAAPNRREARRAKKNCCPAPTCCAPVTSCDVCDSCGGGTIIATEAAPATLESKPGEPTPAPAPSPAPDKPPPDPKPPAEGRAEIRQPKSYSPLASGIGFSSPTTTPNPKPRAEEPKPEPPRESGVSEAAPITISDDPPPAPPAIEPPAPASGSGNYQEYIERYFNRKSAEPAVPKEEPVAPEVNPAPEPSLEPSLDEPPTLAPPKPAKEYNDPFRPTSYRSSQERTWRDSSGASRMKARFLGVDDKGFALMQREDGKRSRVPLANLSASDQRFIELLAIRDTNVNMQNIASRPRGK